MRKLSKRKIFRIVWLSLVAAFMIWNWSTFQSRDLPKSTFLSSEKVSVAENDDEITFNSTTEDSGIEVIFFPEGLADPKAHAPLCRKIAENGFTCHLIKMAWRLPQNDYQKITKLFDLKSKYYVIGGHSQGGKMAAQFVYEHPNLMKGLFLMGTSHPRDVDLSNRSIPTLKIYAENDGLASVKEVMDNKDKLPKNGKMVLIKGGNHSQFGYLGKLFTDNSAQITVDAQQQLTFENLIAFLNEIKNANVD